MSFSSNDSTGLLEYTTTPGKLFYIKKAKKRSRNSEDDSQTPPSSPDMSAEPPRRTQRKKSGISRPRSTPFTTLVKASFGSVNDYSFLEDLEEKIFCIEASSIEQNFEQQNFDIDDANKSLVTINYLIGQAPDRETGTLHEAIVLEILEKAKKTLDSLICKKLACTLTTKDLKDSLEPFLDLKKML